MIKKQDKKQKKAQVTIFIILGVIIVIAVILFFYLYGGLSPGETDDLFESPEKSVEDCFREVVKKASIEVFKSNGYIHNEPSETIEYLNQTVPYLCYISGNYQRCVIQEPMFTRHIESEIKKEAEQGINNCFEELKSEVESNRYEFEMGDVKNYSLILVPNEIKVRVDREVTIRKGNDFERREIFETFLKDSAYELSIIAQKISNQESLYCNSEYVEMIRQYKNFKIRKKQLGNDPKIYTIEDTRDDKRIMFAIRGCVIDVPS